MGTQLFTLKFKSIAKQPLKFPLISILKESLIGEFTSFGIIDTRKLKVHIVFGITI